MDLTKHYLRSPWETLAGVYFLPRSIDKKRAFLAGTLGANISHTHLSEWVFELFDAYASTFEEIVRSHGTDEAVLASLVAIHEPSADEIADCNKRLSLAPDGNPKALTWLHGMMSENGFGDRLDVVTFFDAIDLDEGREVPIGGRAR